MKKGRRKRPAKTSSPPEVRSDPEDRSDPARPEEQNASDPEGKALPFPVVGIGASAGGVEALTQFMKALGDDTGMAFVIVQHLDPTHSSFLVEILSRATHLPIVEVEDRMVVEQDRVYVIPPGTSMEISGGHLRLSPREKTRGQPRPIDIFMRSLAEHQRHNAIGVVLSGTANDGTLGLSAIKAEGGITFAQDDTAQYQSMPRSAITEGCVDFVLPADEIAKEIERISKHPLVAPVGPEKASGAVHDPSMTRILEHLRAGSGVDFSNYKRNTLYRRIIRRVVLHKLANLEEYVRFLQTNPIEVDALYKDILINVTSFFRNPEAYDVLKSRVFPRLTQGRSRHDPLRMWVLGCSTGEESYSIAMAFAEFLESSGQKFALQIFATDLNGSSIEKARAGIYSKTIASDLSPDRLRRFFSEVDGSYRIRKDVRDSCVFARHNVLTEPPFSRMDLISCRNLLIYLDASVQQRIVPTLHYALRPAGFLWLGTSETIGSYRDLFELEDTKHKFYSKKSVPTRAPANPGLAGYTLDPRASLRHGNIPLPSDAGANESHKEADRILLAKFAPPSVLINGDLEILQFRGDTGRYLAPMSGKASLNLLKMLREGLLVGVRGAVHKAKREDAVVREDGLRVKSNGGYQDVRVSVIPVKGNSGAEGMFLVLFEERSRPEGTHKRDGAHERKAADAGELEREDQRLKQELAATREYLQSVIEQQEAANEELQSANEEVQSSNEELQSINEELETSKEEIQSSNEELATLNEELHNRNLELSQSNNDLVNLLSSVQMAIVMLGPDLRIRRFTPAAEKLLNLIPADVGRPIGDMKLLDIPDLEGELAGVIDTVTVREFEIQDKSGRWYSLRLRPYRTLDNKIDGAVIVLVDVDALKRGQEALRRQAELLEQAHEPILMWQIDDGLIYWNRGAEEVYGYTREQALGQLCGELLQSSLEPGPVRDALEKHGRWTGEVENTCANGEKVWVLSRMVLVHDAEGNELVLGTDSPITERKQMEAALMQRAEELLAADRAKNEFLAMLAHELRNPLAPLRNAIQLIRDPGAEGETVALAQEMMERQIQNMSRMVDDLLDASRMTRGKIQLKRSPVRVDTVIARAIASNRPALDARGQDLAVSIPADPIWVEGDEVRLEQVFCNLVNNASKFTPTDGHIQVSAKLAMQETNSRSGKDAQRKGTGARGNRNDKVTSVEVRVRDDGIGIDGKTLPRVFDLFQQADQSLARTQGGLGIGLTLARHLMELHGGTLKAHSEGLGRGSEFVVTLPVLSDEELSQRPPSRDEKRFPVPHRPRRILVVDDNVDSADSLTMLLRLVGHTVEVSYDGANALEVADSFEPDVVILDIGLPGLDGFETGRRLRKKLGKKILLIGLSGYGRDEDRSKAMDAGFDQHLLKPAEFERVQELLDRSP